MHKWLPRNKQTNSLTAKLQRGVEVGELAVEFCGGSAIKLCTSKHYNDLYFVNVSATLRISTRTESRSELSADLTGMNMEVVWTLFCLFREAIYERACTWSVTPPTSLSRRNKQYLEGSTEGVDWLTNYQMSVVTFKIFIYEIIGAIPPLNG